MIISISDFQICSIEPQRSAEGSPMLSKGLGKGRARGFAVFIPLLYDGFVHTNSLEKRLLLTKSLKTTSIVHTSFGWLTTPSHLVCSRASAAPISPSGRCSDRGGTRARPLAFCLHGVCHVCHPYPCCFSCPSFHFILKTKNI